MIDKNSSILFELERKISTINLSISDLFGEHLYFDNKIIDPIGNYVFFDKDGYHILQSNIHGIENHRIYKTEEEVVFQLIWEGITNYIYTTNKFKPNSKKIVHQLLKDIDVSYYDKVK